MDTALGVIDDSIFADVSDGWYFTMVRTERDTLYESLENIFFYNKRARRFKTDRDWRDEEPLVKEQIVCKIWGILCGLYADKPTRLNERENCNLLKYKSFSFRRNCVRRHLRFEVRWLVLPEDNALLDVTPYRLVEKRQCFWWTSDIFRAERRRLVPPKFLYLFLHQAIRKDIPENRKVHDSQPFRAV